MNSPLENLAAAGHLHSEPVDPGEYAGLLSSGRIRLADAVNTALSLQNALEGLPPL
jgi:hypothetical protein